MAGLKRQFWGQDETDLWTARLNSWIAEFGSRNVEACAEWVVDNLEQFEDGIVTIGAFKTAMLQSRPKLSGDGPIVMCLVCDNNGFYMVGDRATKCPHPPDKQQHGWYKRKGITIPPGESLDSMRENFIQFEQLLKDLSNKKRITKAPA